MRSSKSAKPLHVVPGHAPLPSGHACLWRRLDTMGHDACRYVADELGWLIEGCAVYAEHDRVATLSYRVRCDEAWRSRSASVSGWVGSEALTIDVVHTPGDRWTVNGREVPELAGLIDIDLGFTPATNMSAIRRLDLAVGERAEIGTVWLDDADWQIKPLRQIYARAEPQAYDYESPAHHFHARLVTDEAGAIAEYPGLWHRE